MTNTNGGTTKYRIDILEQRVNSMDDKIDLLMTNHIPHLREEILSMKTRINVLTIINVGSIILGILTARILK